MQAIKRQHLKNEMIAANFLANFVGVFFVSGLMFKFESGSVYTLWKYPAADIIDALFRPLSFLFVGGMTLLYERPVRAYLDRWFSAEPVSAELKDKARLRLLNEPFALIALDLSMWVLAAILYPLMHWVNGSPQQLIQLALFNSLSTGLVTITVAFFLLEHVLQKRLAPVFFPEGGLSSVPRTLRIRIRTRLAALLVACNIIPLLSIILILMRTTGGQYPAAEALSILRSAVITQALLFIGIGLCLTMLVGRNLSIPFREIIRSLRDIRNGRFEKKIAVSSNDEIGYAGDAINEMAAGLKEREQMRASLMLAMEVQQNLLPRGDPLVEGLDIAGTSIYCEETGGDYFDYLNVSEEKLLVVVGDVSDHGVSAAMLMTTVRAFLRQRASRSGSLEKVVGDVNRQLVSDVEDSGRFMTLFALDVDRGEKSICWVNAGHDSAMVLDPGSDGWVQLARTGLPIGVSETAAYSQMRRLIQPGQIIVIGTDGVWESQNSQGRMFGKQRLSAIVRDNQSKPAKDILNAVIDAIEQFCGPVDKSDDVTLVIVKIV